MFGTDYIMMEEIGLEKYFKLCVLISLYIESVSNWIDHRTNATGLNAEQTLSKDMAPVDVDAVLFWSDLAPLSHLC